MRSLRSLLLVAFVACHAAVTMAGPSLHDLLGNDHGASWGHAAPGHGSKAVGHDGDDCTACHHLSLVLYNPRSVGTYSAPRVERVTRPLQAQLPPLEFRTVAPSRAPPAPAPHLPIA
ncbi:hypothetical protein [Paludisphaera sp.]|uniref:hypothetical protein n=1 Tax=Paludisphaera sp. TaxID=2017432 RepID=UPI00301BCD96